MKRIRHPKGKTIASERQNKIEILKRRLEVLKAEYEYYNKRLSNLLVEEEYYRAKKENREEMIAGIECPRCGGKMIANAGRRYVCLSVINSEGEKCFYHFKVSREL